MRVDRSIEILFEEQAARTVYDDIYKITDHRLYDKPYSVYFYGNREECMFVYRTLRFGGIWEPKEPINGMYSHEWFSRGPMAIEFSQHMKPILEVSKNPIARQKARYCR